MTALVKNTADLFADTPRRTMLAPRNAGFGPHTAESKADRLGMTAMTVLLVLYPAMATAALVAAAFIFSGSGKIV